MTQIIEMVTAPDGVIYEVWARQSTDHIDCSITRPGNVASETYDPMYMNVLYHPTDDAVAALVNSIKTAIIVGMTLPEGIYKQG